MRPAWRVLATPAAAPPRKARSWRAPATARFLLLSAVEATTMLDERTRLWLTICALVATFLVTASVVAFV
jgi:hypothetical protein